jgi:two-component system cell cycle sensor histidine kinase/response regulator CckA
VTLLLVGIALGLAAAGLGALAVRARASRASPSGVEEREALQRLETQLAEAQRFESLGLVAGAVAHDFNNLLTVILGNARLALGEAPDGRALHQRLVRIHAAAEHGAALTEQMIIYSGRGSFVRKPADLSQLVEGMQELVRAAIPPRTALALAADAPAWSEVDETQLRQVVLALVSRAGEALGDEAGRIAIRCGTVAVSAQDLEGASGAPDLAPGDYAFVEVADTAPSLDAEAQRRLFEPLAASRGLDRGLGLAAVLGIVRSHGGAVKVESGATRGTVVRVLLPGVGHPLGDARASAGTRHFEEAGYAARVLLIEDQPGVLEVAAEFLERAGFTVTVAATGREGLARFRETPGAFEAAVVDLSMHDLSGEAVAAELRALRPDLPVVLASGLSAEHAASRTLELGAARFLRKPYAPDALARAVVEVLAERRAPALAPRSPAPSL